MILNLLEPSNMFTEIQMEVTNVYHSSDKDDHLYMDMKILQHRRSN
jgi:hypothetical protein